MEAELKRVSKRAMGGAAVERPRRADEQTLLYPFDLNLAWLAVSYLRTPSRVLWDLYAARAMRLEPLYAELMEWMKREDRGWLGSGLGISVEVKHTEGFPAGPLQLQGTVKNALIDGAQARGIALHLEPEHPDLLISVRGAPPVISIDLGGGSQHVRGYRLDRGEAPLRENLAAQMLILARWDARHEALVDPLSGSGTIPIEAALMARGAPLIRPPRVPLAARIPCFAPLAERTLVDLFPGASPPIIAGELDRKEIEGARRNARRAGVDDQVIFLEGDFRRLDRAALERAVTELRPKGMRADVDLSRGLILSNPPYGERLSAGEDLDPLYRDLRDFCLGMGSGWRAGFLIANPALEEIFARRPILKKPMSNARLRAQLVVYDLENAGEPESNLDPTE